MRRPQEGHGSPTEGKHECKGCGSKTAHVELNQLEEIHLRKAKDILKGYNDTGYSNIPVTVTVFWSKRGSPYSENPGYSDIPLTGTVFGRPNIVTISGEACA